MDPLGSLVKPMDSFLHALNKMHIHKKETSYIGIQFSKIRKQIGDMWVSLLTRQAFAVCLITITVSKETSINISRYLQQL